jgi:chromosome segregation ATPase
LEDALAREEALTNYKNNMDVKFKQLNDRIFDLEASNQDLADENNSLRNQNMLITNQVQQTKRNFEDQEYKRGMEFDKTIEELNSLHNDKKELKRNLEIKERALDEITNEARKFKREAESARNELEESVQTIAELKNLLANERMTGDNVIKREKDFKERNDKLATELEKAQIRLQNIEAQHARAIDSLRNDYQIRHQKYEQMLDT